MSRSVKFTHIFPFDINRFHREIFIILHREELHCPWNALKIEGNETEITININMDYVKFDA